MSSDLMCTLLNQGSTGNEILAILDSIVSDFSTESVEEVVEQPSTKKSRKKS